MSEATSVARGCTYCGAPHQEGRPDCARCGALLPRADGTPPIDLEADRATCPGCAAINTTSAEYCTQCGTPMAIITRVLELSHRRERGPLETWRVYGIETRMVARDDQLTTLLNLQRDSAKAPSCVWVGVSGELGIGKSRLLGALRQRLDESFSEAILLYAEERDVAGPFGAVDQLLRERFYIAQQEPQAIAKRKLLEAVAALIGKGEQAERVSHQVGPLMGLTFEDSPHLEGRSPGQIDQRSFDALVTLLRADAARNPLVLVLEDVQRSQEPTLLLLRHLREQLAGCPVMFVLSWQPRELGDNAKLLDDITLDAHIKLAPLSDAEVEALVRDTLRRVKDIPALLIERIVESAHGNPLTVEELLRVLLSEGTIDTRGADGWEVHTRALKKLKLPTTVEAAVRMRLGALSPDEREVLAMAACIGESFWPGLVRCLWRLREEHGGAHVPERFGPRDTSSARTNALLESLERKDMVRRRADTTLPGQVELYFKHQVERKAAYDELESQLRQRYHRLIAQWLERQPLERPEELSEVVARHYDRARCLEHAASRYLSAARTARDRHANRKAIELYTRALSYTGDADIAAKLDAFHELGSLYTLLGEHDQALAYFREMLRYAWLLDAPNKAGVAYDKIGRAYRSLGDLDDALTSLERALELFQGMDDGPGISSVLDNIGKVHWIRGRHEDALRYYDAALALRREDQDKRSIALSLNHMGSLRLQRGELREAMRDFREALELRREVGDRQGVAESFNNLGILCMERDELPQARALFEESLALVRELGYRALEGIVLNNLGEVHMLMGELDASQPLLERAMELAEESGERRLLFDLLRNMGKLRLKRGERAEAIARMSEALEVAQALDARALMGIGSQHLADLHAHFLFDPAHSEESAREADRLYKSALTLLRDSRSEPELGRCLSSYGNFLLERGQLVQGKQQLELASDIFKRLEMRKFLKATDQLLGEL